MLKLCKKRSGTLALWLWKMIMSHIDFVRGRHTTWYIWNILRMMQIKKLQRF